MTADVVLATARVAPAVCGVGDHMARLSQALRDRGIDARLWAMEHRPGSVADLHGPPALLDALTGARAIVIAYAPGLWRNEIGEEPTDALRLARVARRHGLRVVVLWHEPPIRPGGGRRRVHRYAEAQLRRSADAIFVSDPAWSTEMPGRGVRPEVVALPSNLESVRTVGESAPAPDPRLVTVFGIRTPLMDDELLTRVVDRLLAYGIRVEAIGPWWDRADAPGLRVRGVLDVEDVREALARSTALLIPSRAGIGAKSGVLAAALEVGVPVVVTDLGQRRSPVIHDAPPGFVSTVPDPEAAVAAIRRLADDPDARARLRELGREHYWHHRSWDSVAAHVARAAGLSAS